jgi:hypothetical protein
MKRITHIIGALAICVIALMVYFAMQPRGDVTPQGEEASASIAWISLAVAAVSLATAVVGLVQKLVELRAGGRR